MDSSCTLFQGNLLSVKFVVAKYSCLSEALRERQVSHKIPQSHFTISVIDI